MRSINLDMDALRSFVTGMDAGSFAQAADRLGRSTSAVSAQLKKLEDQAGTVLLRRAGRGLVLTEAGEALLSYARRLLSLNDEAVSALRSAQLEGWVRLGLQEDFGETILPQVLGRFARAHPKVRIEGRIARNSELKAKIATGQLDLALAWDDGLEKAERIAALRLCWLAGAGEAAPLREAGEPVPLVALEAPCLLRQIACDHLDKQGLAWRIAFVSPSLGGLWAATAAGLGIALRTAVGRPATVTVLDPAPHGLPALPSLGLVLHRAEGSANPLTDHLAAIIRQAVQEALQPG
ncbi:LysR family transcriptional regulator [Xaviernesmea oryzae]|uniref:HTH-type transcriptional regulator TtuA n=1 Tax=Xaviernesmea oryzae TaxID=464029 RepID=A0A1Q9B1V8_9HYPH|nr:LysR substrate-binding domain-containing protein [Xaviernesmea oryzae]OLP61972.1 LysR family transcriptional regulator [Xaviernesmea oryzae]SEK98901.1 DNA-binding transcriptional regulator, LysR family [Xaviernesmea oryzae]